METGPLRCGACSAHAARHDMIRSFKLSLGIQFSFAFPKELKKTFCAYKVSVIVDIMYYLQFTNRNVLSVSYLGKVLKVIWS